MEPKNFSFVPFSRYKVGDLATLTTLTTLGVNSVDKPHFPGLTTSLVEPPSGMAVTGKTPYLPQILYSNRSSRYYIVMLQYDFITQQYNFQRPLLCLPLLHLPLPMSLFLPTGFLTIIHICYLKCFCLSVFVIQLLSPQGGLGQEWLPSLADARRNLNHSRELCEELGVCGWHWRGINVFHFTAL